MAEAIKTVCAVDVVETAEQAKLRDSVPTSWVDIKTFVESGRVHWAGEQVGDVVFRRLPRVGELALKRVGWKPSLHCQKPAIAVQQLTGCMHSATEKPIDAMMTAARSLFNGPAPAQKVAAELWHNLAAWSLIEARAAGLDLSGN